MLHEDGDNSLSFLTDVTAAILQAREQGRHDGCQPRRKVLLRRQFFLQPAQDLETRKITWFFEGISCGRLHVATYTRHVICIMENIHHVTGVCRPSQSAQSRKNPINLCAPLAFLKKLKKIKKNVCHVICTGPEMIPSPEMILKLDLKWSRGKFRNGMASNGSWMNTQFILSHLS